LAPQLEHFFSFIIMQQMIPSGKKQIARQIPQQV
jgi:hypothetical protein